MISFEVHPGVVCISLSLDERVADSGSLSREEMDCIPHRLTKMRRAEFILGRMAAHQALKNLGVKDQPILRGKRGEPLWPAGVIGSITHTAGQAVAAVCSSADFAALGIDLEPVDALRKDISPHICTGEEIAFLNTRCSEPRPTSLLRIFSAKECVFKAFYPLIHRYIGFKEVELRWNAEMSEFTGKVPARNVDEERVLRAFCGSVQMSEKFVFATLSATR